MKHQSIVKRLCAWFSKQVTLAVAYIEETERDCVDIAQEEKASRLQYGISPGEKYIDLG